MLVYLFACLSVWLSGWLSGCHFCFRFGKLICLLLIACSSLLRFLPGTGGKAVSIVLGTGVGGLLAQPALNYPSVFSESGIFGRYVLRGMMR